MHHEGEVVLPELLDKLGIRQPILLGHSDGASISIIFAGKYPDAVRGLILEAPHVFVEDLTIASIEQAKVAYKTTDLPGRLERYHANVDATFWGWNDIWLDPNFRSWNIEEYLPAIRCPILCIQGKDDEYGTSRTGAGDPGRLCRDRDCDAGRLQALAASRSSRIRRWSVWQSSSRRWRAGGRAGSR